MTIIKKSTLTLVNVYMALFLFSNEAVATNYYVDATNGSNSASGLLGDPVDKISAAVQLMSSSGGDTVIIKDGTYAETVSGIPNGTIGNYNVIRAENDGGVLVFGSLRLLNNQYIQVEGLKFSYLNSGGSGIDSSDHIKILRTAFEGGALQGNVYSFGIGDGSSYILLEDCWIYGPGGRQNLIMYEVSEIVMRRVVIRHDSGWSSILKPDPEGVGTVYNSSNVELQNVIVIDSASNPANINMGSEWVGAFTQTNNSGTVRDNNITGTIVLNVEGNAFEHGGGYGAGDTVLNINYKDVVVWWSNGNVGHGAGAALSMNNSARKTVIAEKMTIGNMGYAGTIWNGNSSSIQLKNSIITGLTQFPFNTPSSSDGVINESYNNCFSNNNDNCSGTGLISSDPQNSGLSYIPRIEDSSALMTSGQAGGRQGAVIVNKIGVSGSLWGDSGYNTLTAESLWPWPNEDRIRNDMRAVSNRGFAADGQTLTNYIWQVLGNTTPSDIASTVLPVPKNILITKE